MRTINRSSSTNLIQTQRSDGTFHLWLPQSHTRVRKKVLRTLPVKPYFPFSSASGLLAYAARGELCHGCETYEFKNNKEHSPFSTSPWLSLSLLTVCVGYVCKARMEQEMCSAARVQKTHCRLSKGKKGIRGKPGITRISSSKCTNTRSSLRSSLSHFLIPSYD